MKKRSLIKYLAYSFQFLIIGILLLTASITSAQQLPDSLRSVVTSVNGNIVDCQGEIVIDVSKADIESIFGNRTAADIVPGTVILVDGKFIKEMSTPSRTVLLADHVNVDLRRNIRVSAPIQNIDQNRKSIMVANREVFIDENTRLLKKKKRKLQVITFDEFSAGQDVQIDADVLPSGMILARKIVRILKPGLFSPEVIAFITKVDGTTLELEGGFVADVSRLFPFPIPITADVLCQVSFFDPFSTGPLKASGLGVSSKDIFLAGLLENVNLTDQTMTIFGRDILVNDETKFFGNITSLRDLKIGKQLSVNLSEFTPNLVASEIIQ